MARAPAVRKVTAVRAGDPYHDEEVAETYADHATDSAYNAHYDRPAVLDLVGEVEGLQVLDAGCGPGIYAEVLADAGAQVTGFDASEAMLGLAADRLGDRVTLLHAELGARLPLDGAVFDRVVCALAIHYAANRTAVFEEFFRLLRPGGSAVVSTQHPTTDWLRLGGSYFEIRQVSEQWSQKWGETEFTFWREPLGSLCDAATGAGFLISRIVEPQPAPTMEARYPEIHDRLSTAPGFLVLALVKPV